MQMKKMKENCANSTEYFSNVIIKNDQNQSADRPKLKTDIMLKIIKAYKFSV